MGKHHGPVAVPAAAHDAMCQARQPLFQPAEHLRGLTVQLHPARLDAGIAHRRDAAAGRRFHGGDIHVRARVHYRAQGHGNRVITPHGGGVSAHAGGDEQVPIVGGERQRRHEGPAQIVIVDPLPGPLAAEPVAQRITHPLLSRRPGQGKAHPARVIGPPAKDASRVADRQLAGAVKQVHPVDIGRVCQAPVVGNQRADRLTGQEIQQRGADAAGIAARFGNRHETGAVPVDRRQPRRVVGAAGHQQQPFVRGPAVILHGRRHVQHPRAAAVRSHDHQALAGPARHQRADVLPRRGQPNRIEHGCGEERPRGIAAGRHGSGRAEQEQQRPESRAAPWAVHHPFIPRGRERRKTVMTGSGCMGGTRMQQNSMG